MAFTGTARALGQFGGDLAKAKYGLEEIRRKREQDRLQAMQDAVKLQLLQREAALPLSLGKAVGPPRRNQQGAWMQGYADPKSGQIIYRPVPPEGVPLSKQEEDISDAESAGLSREQAMKQYFPKAYSENIVKSMQAGEARAVDEAIKAGRDPNTDPGVQAWRSMQPKPRTSTEKSVFDTIKANNPGIDDMSAWLQTIDIVRTQPGVERMESRVQPVVDPGTGGVYAETAKQAIADHALLPGTKIDKAYTAYSNLREITRATEFMKKTLPALDQGPAQVALINQALASGAHAENPLALAAAFQGLMNSRVFKTQMSPVSQRFIVANFSAREQIMGLNRLITGQAGISDARTKAVWDTLPDGADTPYMAKQKAAQIDRTIFNASEGLPTIGLIPAKGTTPSGKDFLEDLKAKADKAAQTEEELGAEGLGIGAKDFENFVGKVSQATGGAVKPKAKTAAAREKKTPQKAAPESIPETVQYVFDANGKLVRNTKKTQAQ